MTIPNSIASIGSSAFSGCSNLTSIDVKALTPPTIAENAFEGLYDSALVTIPREAVVRYLVPNWLLFTNLRPSGSEKFISSASDGLLTYYLIPAAGTNDRNLAVVKSGSYSGEITIPERFTITDPEGNNDRYYISGIGYQAFKGSGITKVNFNSRIDLKTIGEEAFYGCWRLTELNIPESVTSIGNSAFSGCSSVMSLTVGNAITSIPNDCFKGLTRLTSIKLGSNIKEIGANAFNGCTSMTEVVLPPLVETIGKSAFDNCTQLSTIIMGANLKTIGDEAFNKAKADNIYITALTPPVASYSAFSYYSGKLHLQNQEAKNAYYDALSCWDRFDSDTMIVPTKLEISETELNGEVGETIQLTATIEPENVTLPQIFWRSSNPEAAVVDINGLVTIKDSEAKYKVIAETLYANGPTSEIAHKNPNIPTLVESITLTPEEWSGVEGETIQLTATVLPEDATDKSLIWESSDETVATVDNSGLVSVLREGNCVITATAADGSGITAQCRVSGMAGIEDILSSDNVSADVYTTSGLLVKKGCSKAQLQQLGSGIYIVKVSPATVGKVLIK